MLPPFFRRRATVMLALAFAPALFACQPEAASDTSSAAAVVNAAAPAVGATALNVNADGVMLHGYDPVAYFVQASAVPGSAEFTAEHGGATYRFASAEHRDTFLANPSAYEPQFGGYCAMGVAIDKKLDIDPTQFTIHEGKLYLNVNADAAGMFREKIDEHVAAANNNWSSVSTRPTFDRM